MSKGGEADEDATPGRNVVYELYNEEVSTRLPEVKGQRLRIGHLVREVLVQNDRSARTGLGRLLLRSETFDIISDTFWWVFLRFVSDSSEIDVQPKPPPLPPSRRRADKRIDATMLPLHMYPQTLPAVTRSIDSLSRLAAPGSVQNGIPTEEICSCASSPRVAGSSMMSETESCRSLLSAEGMLSPRPPQRATTTTTTTTAATGLMPMPPSGGIKFPSPRYPAPEGGGNDTNDNDQTTLSLAVISNMNPFDKEDLISDEEQLRYNRIAKRYIKVVELICKVQPPALQDMYYTQYPDIIAQVVCLAMYKSHLPTPESTKREVLGFTTYWMSGVQRKDITNWKVGKVTNTKRGQKKAAAAAGRKPAAAKRTSTESSSPTGLELDSLSRELDTIKRDAQTAFNRKMRATKLGADMDTNRDEQPKRVLPIDRGHVSVMGSVKKLRPLRPRVVSLLRGLRQNKTTPAWFEFGRVGFRKKAAKVGVGNFCTTDYSPLIQHALMQRLDYSVVKPADMLWSCHDEPNQDT